MTADKIVITLDDLAVAQALTDMGSEEKHPIPLRWRLASGLLVLCLPALFVVSIINLVAARRKEPRFRRALALHWCGLMLASTALWAAIVIGLGPRILDHTLPIVDCGSSITVANLPLGGGDTVLTGREIARDFSPLVVAIFHPRQAELPSHEDIGSIARGAGSIAYASGDGFLVLTSRHVTDDLSGEPGVGQEVGLFLQDHQLALATVVGIHNELDLALLWVGRDSGGESFVQPLRSFDSVDIGEQIYAIGHPQGLAFSISSGLVSQKWDGDLVQISAPVSPGNSGGPIYDIYGRLVGVVQSVFDKTIDPNAENLNFAVRVDDLFVPDAWTLADKGRSAVEAIAEQRLTSTQTKKIASNQTESERVN